MVSATTSLLNASKVLCQKTKTILNRAAMAFMQSNLVAHPSPTADTKTNSGNTKIKPLILFFSWLYRILPSACQKGVYTKCQLSPTDFKSNFTSAIIDPQQFRWKPINFSKKGTNFINGIKSMCGAGDPSMKDGLGIHSYSCDISMEKTAFYSSDGDMLIVPQQGDLFITTEFGRILVQPQEICVIQRGIKFKVDVTEPSRGWICETYKSHFVLPDLGPIGANGLANPVHFEIPEAWYEDKSEDW